MNYVFMLLAYAESGWWPMYGADAQHTRVQLLRAKMTSAPSVISHFTLYGAAMSEGPTIAIIGGVGYTYVAHADPDAGYVDAAAIIKLVGGVYTPLYVWDRDIALQGSAVAVADMDLNGAYEIMFSERYNTTNGWPGGIWYHRATDGGYLWTYNNGGSSTTAAPKSASSATLYDVDGNGTLELLFGDLLEDTVFCVNANGTLRWRANVTGYVEYAPAVGQVIPGGDPEVVIGTTDDSVMILNARTGARIAQRSLRDFIGGSTAVTICSAPAIANVDGLGNMEVFIYTKSPDSLWCLRPSGSTLNLVWAQQVPGSSVSYSKQSPAICDVNGDNYLDLVIGSGSTSTSHPARYDRVLCFRGYDGASVWTSPILSGDVHRGVAIADIDEDGRWEVIAVANTSTTAERVYCIAGENGSIQWNVDLPSCSRASDPSVGDVDNDGCSEIVVAGTAGARFWVLDREGANCGPVYEAVDEDDQSKTEMLTRAWFSRGTLHIISALDGPMDVRIYDPTGRLVFARDISLVPGENSLAIDLKPGLYIGLLSQQDITTTLTLIVGGK